jgi:hypothetical protein
MRSITRQQMRSDHLHLSPRSLVVHSPSTETMTSNDYPLINHSLRSVVETSGCSTFLLFTLITPLQSKRGTYTAPDMTDSLYSSSSSSSSSMSYSSITSSDLPGGSSPPSDASLLESMTACRSLSDSGSIQTRSDSLNRKVREYRRRYQSHRDNGSRRTSSWDSVGGQAECSRRVKPSLDDLSKRKWRRLKRRSLDLPPDASWVVSIHAVVSGKQS